ncbi:sodium:calcium antiporter [Anianabacter salinae]|uniref:sodium:calcium antiporter n=1 Tax=Anianabacter salinae TaxID=2851023 RepID=UPI00225E0565|nr:sodium:calcium antiporter [Anianabacter salinae]MBV0912915.1 sodium:calcium antiporter [Anianabacter salinae]
MFAALSTPALVAAFAAAALVVLILGTRMTGLADRIADRTGLGEALVGGVLLGASTSLSGTVVSVTSALEGQASLAFANGIGGIAAQTAFLAVADLMYRRANLEHTSAEIANVVQGALLFLLLSVPLVAYTLPEWSVWGVHPVSVAMLVIYASGVYVTHRVRENPMWRPVSTGDTQEDTPDEAQHSGAAWRLVGGFAVMMAVLAVAGYVIAQTGGQMAARFGLSQTIVGALMTAVVTSMPELVTTVAAVRRGAFQLAVGGIIGGNTFDTLFLSLSDFGYRDGSIYHAIQTADLFWLAIGLVMTAVLMIGLIVRERGGPLRIGTESLLLLLIYAGAIAAQIALG